MYRKEGSSEGEPSVDTGHSAFLILFVSVGNEIFQHKK